ncbi:MAG: tetratricopeptide repeat protein [bacterium]
MGYKSEEGRTLGLIGRTYWRLGDYSNALEYLEKALRYGHSQGNKSYLVCPNFTKT